MPLFRRFDFPCCVHIPTHSLCLLLVGVDVAEALRLIKVALQQAALDPETGTIDMDLINTGFRCVVFHSSCDGNDNRFYAFLYKPTTTSAAARGRMSDIARDLRALLEQRSAPSFSYSQVHLCCDGSLHTLSFFFFLAIPHLCDVVDALTAACRPAEEAEYADCLQGLRQRAAEPGR